MFVTLAVKTGILVYLKLGELLIPPGVLFDRNMKGLMCEKHFSLPLLFGLPV